ncbi:MAG: hypothetical protein AB7F21_07560 [Desulfuromonadales bacterium]
MSTTGTTKQDAEVESLFAQLSETEKADIILMMGNMVEARRLRAARGDLDR